MKQKSSTRREGYHGANTTKKMDRMHNALINLATVAAEDREKMITQCKTIANLTGNVAALTRQIQQATTGNNRGPGFPVDRRSQKNSKWVNGKHLRDVGGYCWTHRHYVEISHVSKTRRCKKEGHKENAKRADIMGGNLYGKTRA